jgi:hypothetical protein
MDAAEIIGLAASVSLLAGWRLYACVLAIGIAMRLGIIELPQHLAELDVLANPWVMGVAGIGVLAELLADKIAWLDSVWDAVHTLIRPVAGALLALAIIDPTEPVWQVVILLLGGSAALLSHGAKAGARAVVNTSPEPFSNVVVSTVEDIVTTGGLWLVLAYPQVAVVAAILLLAIAVGLLLLIRKLWRQIRPRRDANGSTA